MGHFRDTLIRLQPNPYKQFISRGRIVWLTDLDGFMEKESLHGLFVHETRMLCHHRYLINGEEPHPVALSNVTLDEWIGHYVAVPPGQDIQMADQGSGMMSPASEYTLELKVNRRIDGHAVEDISLTNYTQAPTTFELALRVDADFADVQEVPNGRRQKGRITRDWEERDGVERALKITYHAEHEYDEQGEQGKAILDRGISIQAHAELAPPEYRDGGLAFSVHLEPHETWRARVDYIPHLEEELRPPGIDGEEERRQRLFLAESAACLDSEEDSLSSVVFSSLRRARHDLAGLRLFDVDRDERAWTVAAGLPIYASLYGRDALTAGWQAALLGPEMMEGALHEIARWQGEEVNDWRDEEPGRMPHELHTGPLKALNYLPTARNYGSTTTSAFYPTIVSELWHWTGSKERIRPFVEPAVKALQWLDDFGRRDDGFYYYKTHSKDGVKHQAWKDSPDAIVDDAGRSIEPPIAACEEQAFVYSGKLQLSEVLWWLGRKDSAKRLFDEARVLKKRFNEVFWMENEGFVATGLDADGVPIRSVGSNPGHCVVAGILTAEHAERTARRMFEDDLFSGWGVRTLSSENPAYNPYSYHRGSVWPVEQATFALAFMRYGLHDLTQKICRSQFEASALFANHRLPEVFSGHQRGDGQPFPAFYPQANAPQAWSASAVFMMVQSMLGLYPYGPLNMLIIDPHLPAWLPHLTVRNLRVGEARATIRFYRKSDGSSSYDVEEKEGSLHILRQPSPWSLTAGYWERFKDAMLTLLPV